MRKFRFVLVVVVLGVVAGALAGAWLLGAHSANGAALPAVLQPASQRLRGAHFARPEGALTVLRAGGSSRALDVVLGQRPEQTPGG